MKRRLFKIGLLLLGVLLGGAIVNVAVAWGFAVRQPPTHLVLGWYRRSCTLDNELAIAEKSWFVEAGRAEQSIRRAVTLYAVSSTVRRAGSNYATYIAPWADNRYVAIEGRFGWPALSLVGGKLAAFNQPTGSALTSKWILPIDAFEKSSVHKNFRHGLPLLPLSSGFAINTIFYAAILWLLFFAPDAVRRTIRRRRGLCPACAYPIGTSPVCTECGAVVEPRPPRGGGM